MLLAEGDAISEGNENILIARHQNLVAARLVELFGEDLAEGEGNLFLDRAVLHGAGVVPAVAGIDHDDGLERTLREHVGRDGRARQRRLQAGATQRVGRRRHAGSGGDLLYRRCYARRHRHEGGDFDDEVLIAPVVGLLDAGARDDDRLGHVDDDAGAVGAGEAGLERLDEADGRRFGLVRQPELGFSDLDDHPVRIGEREHLERRRLRQPDDEARALLRLLGCDLARFGRTAEETVGAFQNAFCAIQQALSLQRRVRAEQGKRKEDPAANMPRSAVNHDV